MRYEGSHGAVAKLADMAWDLCLGFCEKPLPSDFWTQQPALKNAPGETIYLLTGQAPPHSSGKPFFGFWSDEWFDLTELAKEASKVCGRLCLVWKIEHSGAGGYHIYSNGEETKKARSDEPDYVLFPAAGIEKTFRHLLRFPEEDDRVCFPELVLEDTSVRCWRVSKDGDTLQLLEANDISQEKMFNYGLDVEPVFPFSSFK